MSTYSFIAVSYYLFPDDRVALDEHAAKILKQLTSSRVSLRPVLEVLQTGTIPGDFGEGRHPLWSDKEGQKAIYVYRYGDTALLIGFCPPQELNLPDAARADWSAIAAQGMQRWGRLFTNGGRSEPYQTARVHVIELDEPSDPVSLRPFGTESTNVPVNPAAMSQPQIEQSSDFLWQFIGSNEHLLLSKKDNWWLYHWCFERAHLFRLLLFHGKADRYRTEVIGVGNFEAKRLKGSPSPKMLSEYETKYKNLSTAVDNFAHELPKAVADAGESMVLGNFLTRTHESWRVNGRNIWRKIAQANNYPDGLEKEKAGGSMDRENRFKTLHLTLLERYDLEGLRTLCAELNVNFDDLRGEGRQAKARELILLLEREGRLDELTRILQRKQPDPRKASGGARSRPNMKKIKTPSLTKQAAKSSRLEIEIKVEPKKVAAFNRNAFRKFWKQKFGGELGDFNQSAQGLSFTWQGANPETVSEAAEKGQLDKAVATNGGVAVFEIKDEKESLYQFIPDIKLKLPRIKDVPPAELLAEKDKVDVVIMTVTDPERASVLNFMHPWPGRREVLKGSMDLMTYRFGRFGNYSVAQVDSTMSTSGREGATLTAQRAISELEPKAMLLVGIAFGVDRKSQRMGDVLVADSIFPYDHAKISSEIVRRGVTIQCGNILANRFRTYRDDWKLDAGGRTVKVHQGLVLSADKLVKNKAFRDSLVKELPTAQGGEMEGHGAYAAAQGAKVEMILIKAICDWGDNLKNDRAQAFAAYAAASLASHVLSKPGVLTALGARDLSQNARNSRVKNLSPMPSSASKALAALTRRPKQSSAQGAQSKPGNHVEIFYSYSHRDEKLRDQLEIHLSLLRRQGLISSWHDRRITASKEWEGEINSHLEAAHIILLLVSANFLASDYIHDVELKRAMERHESREARVVPIILRPCDWGSAPFGKLQALPRDARPVTKWANRDEAFMEIAKGIRAVVEELRST